MSQRRKTQDRRRFLMGAGGVCVALPFLEIFQPKGAHAQAMARPPFVALIVNGNGVVQAEANQFDNNANDPEWFWPRMTGALTQASLTADNQERAIGELAAFADKLLLIRGVNHPYGANGCMHAAGDAQILTAAEPVGSGNQTIAGGESLDNHIARELNPNGTEPIALHAGRYSASGTGYNIPGYISYRASEQPRTPTASPLQAYERLVGMVDLSEQDRALLGARRTAVNDVLKEQIKRLQARTDLPAADRNRLDQHFTAIRELEQRATALELSAEQVAEMKRIDPDPYADVDHETVIRLQMDVLVLALSMGTTQAITLKIGDREDDHTFMLDGEAIHFHDASHMGYGERSRDFLHKIDRIHAGHFRYLLEKLSAVSTDAGALIDQGVTVWTNQVANGAHRFNNIPFVLAGNAKGHFSVGRYLDVGGVSTGTVLNSLLNATGIEGEPFGAGVISDLRG